MGPKAGEKQDGKGCWFQITELTLTSHEWILGNAINLDEKRGPPVVYLFTHRQFLFKTFFLCGMGVTGTATVSAHDYSCCWVLATSCTLQLPLTQVLTERLLRGKQLTPEMWSWRWKRTGQESQVVEHMTSLGARAPFRHYISPRFCPVKATKIKQEFAF